MHTLKPLADSRLTNLKAHFVKHELVFKKPSGTSRGVLTTKPVWYIIVEDGKGTTGIGECSPIWGLSVEKPDTYEAKVKEVCEQIDQYPFWLDSMLQHYPSIRFGLEMALIDLMNKGKRKLYPTPFTEGADSILINGLIWMGEKEAMLTQIEDKLAQGFYCVKMKIGAIDFAAELSLLKAIRERFNANEVELRVDANGAFSVDDAPHKLDQLAQFDLHSIEQPIKAGQWDAMAQLCATTPLPIALDEELIGVDEDIQSELLQTIQPQYIILKPSLVGGFAASEAWIKLAAARNIGWWATSALESNIGLNAIAQWTYTLNNPMPQGLGTGQLYTNNIPCPLTLKGDQLSYDPAAKWELSQIIYT